MANLHAVALAAPACVTSSTLTLGLTRRYRRLTGTDRRLGYEAGGAI